MQQRLAHRPAGLIRAIKAAGSIFVVFFAVLGMPIRSGAQAFPRERAFVYGVTNYDGRLYESTLAPPSVDTVYLLADRTNVLSPRNTLAYFWPITNRYQADWELMNELVTGTLQVSVGGRVERSIELSEYVVQYDIASPQDSLALLFGSEARAKFTEWDKAQSEYRTALEAYYAAQLRWNDQVNILRQKSASGIVPPNLMPPEPLEPVRPTVLSSTPAQGFLIALPVGTYDISVIRADGTLQPDSKKTLVMFEKQRDGISYNVVPQTRWIAAESSENDGDVVYALRGSTLYLQPHLSGRYNDLQYGRMLDPQDPAARPDRSRWVAFDAAPSSKMIVTRGAGPASELPSQFYYVRQLPGTGLGYEVVAFDPGVMEQPSFSGHAIQLNEPEIDIYMISDTGAIVAGSRRRIVALNTDMVWMPYAFGIVPAAMGVIVLLARRRATRRVGPEN